MEKTASHRLLDDLFDTLDFVERENDSKPVTSMQAPYLRASTMSDVVTAILRISVPTVSMAVLVGGEIMMLLGQLEQGINKFPKRIFLPSRFVKAVSDPVIFWGFCWLIMQDLMLYCHASPAARKKVDRSVLYYGAGKFNAMSRSVVAVSLIRWILMGVFLSWFDRIVKAFIGAVMFSISTVWFSWVSAIVLFLNSLSPVYSGTAKNEVAVAKAKLKKPQKRPWLKNKKKVDPEQPQKDKNTRDKAEDKNQTKADEIVTKKESPTEPIKPPPQASFVRQVFSTENVMDPEEAYEMGTNTASLVQAGSFHLVIWFTIFRVPEGTEGFFYSSVLTLFILDLAIRVFVVYYQRRKLLVKFHGHLVGSGMAARSPRSVVSLVEAEVVWRGSGALCQFVEDMEYSNSPLLGTKWNGDEPVESSVFRDNETCLDTTRISLGSLHVLPRLDTAPLESPPLVKEFDDDPQRRCEDLVRDPIDTNCMFKPVESELPKNAHQKQPSRQAKNPTLSNETNGSPLIISSYEQIESSPSTIPSSENVGSPQGSASLEASQLQIQATQDRSVSLVGGSETPRGVRSRTQSIGSRRASTKHRITALHIQSDEGSTSEACPVDESEDEVPLVGRLSTISKSDSKRGGRWSTAIRKIRSGSMKRQSDDLEENCEDMFPTQEGLFHKDGEGVKEKGTMSRRASMRLAKRQDSISSKTGQPLNIHRRRVSIDADNISITESESAMGQSAGLNRKYSTMRPRASAVLPAEEMLHRMVSKAVETIEPMNNAIHNLARSPKGKEKSRRMTVDFGQGTLDDEDNSERESTAKPTQPEPNRAPLSANEVTENTSAPHIQETGGPAEPKGFDSSGSLSDRLSKETVEKKKEQPIAMVRRIATNVASETKAKDGEKMVAGTPSGEFNDSQMELRDAWIRQAACAMQLSVGSYLAILGAVMVCFAYGTNDAIFRPNNDCLSQNSLSRRTIIIRACIVISFQLAVDLLVFLVGERMGFRYGSASQIRIPFIVMVGLGINVASLSSNLIMAFRGQADGIFHAEKRGCLPI
ncbi:hypothetical protein HDU67_006302 [Dinochytrium kinnereticum]|nr:hypothetical protein HDU67_006302 [Dinochytrium kinnereticum]